VFAWYCCYCDVAGGSIISWVASVVTGGLVAILIIILIILAILATGQFVFVQ